MYSSRAASRTLSSLSRSSGLQARRSFAFRTDSPYAVKRQTHFYRSIGLVATLASAGLVYQWCTGSNPLISDVHAETPQEQKQREEIEQAELVFEESKYRQGASKEETRDHISSQHLQVRKSWENPGVWCWGANDGKVAAPDAKSSLIRQPRWLPFFDGKLLRDMKLTRTFGAAISEEGDLLQWGRDYNPEEQYPVATLKGKDLTSLSVSKDRILALSKSGTVYSLSVSQEEQRLGPKPSESSWVPGVSYKSPISYRTITPKDLAWRERVTSLSSGIEHGLFLTSSGRVFSFASGSEAYPSRGQFGIPGLTWFTKPAGPFDMAHEIQALHGFPIKQIATGDYHSVALDKKGRVFSWGNNDRGQLGIGDTSKDTPFFESPQLLPITKLYAGTSLAPTVTNIAAGGNTTFLTVDAQRVAAPNADTVASARAGLGRITAETWACGHGIWGQLGNGRWTHVQSLPTKIQPLSGLFEYDEKKRVAIPIRLRSLSVGSNHVAAIMDNVTHVEAPATAQGGTENDVNWGADVLFFGNNEFFQLGTGKRNNCTTPTYIRPLDRGAEVSEGKRPKDELHRFHATPRATVKVGERWVSFEQRVVCGRGVTAVYSGV